MTHNYHFTEDFPAVTVLKEKRVRARFQHHCSICGGPIARDEVHMYFFIRDEDAIPPRAFASRQHLYCPLLHDDEVVTPDPREGSEHHVQRYP